MLWVICDLQVPSASPVYIHMDCDTTEEPFQIFVEQQKLLSTRSAADGLAAFVASFFIFNLAYPQDLLRLMIFLQGHILSITDNTSSKTQKLREAQKAVLTFSSQLNIAKKSL